MNRQALVAELSELEQEWREARKMAVQYHLLSFLGLVGTIVMIVTNRSWLLFLAFLAYHLVTGWVAGRQAQIANDARIRGQAIKEILE